MVYVSREDDDRQRDRNRDRGSSLLDDGYSRNYIEPTYYYSNTPADIEYTPPPLLDAVEGGDSETLAQIALEMGLNYTDLGTDITDVAIVDGFDSTESIPQQLNGVSALSGLINLETGKLLISVERGKTYGWVEGDISSLYNYMVRLEELSQGENSQDPHFELLYDLDSPSPPSFFKEPGLTLVNNSSQPEQLDSSTPIQSDSSGQEKGIAVTSETTTAVPGTSLTYGVTEKYQGKDYSYHWQIINDLTAIPEDKRDGLFERRKYPTQIDLGVEEDGEIEAEWDFPGRHTIELEIYNHQGQLQGVHYYRQEVQDAAEQARAAFESSPPPKMQPDVYLTWLSTQRQLAQENGVPESELQQIDEAIANATELLGVSEDNPTGEAIAISATLVPKAEPIAAPLQLYIKPIPSGWAIVDLTNPDPGKARTYEGIVRTTGRQASKASPQERTELALNRAWLNFVRDNPHPAGEIVADFPLDIAGEKHRKQKYSDGESTLGKVRNWFSGIGLVTGLGGLALTVATGGVGTVAVGLFLVASASGVVAGGSNIADRVQHSNFQWDGETVLDLVDIAGGLAGGTTTILSLGGKAANVGRLRNAMLIGEAVETGSDVAGGVILGAQYLAQVEQIKSDPNLTEEQKTEAIGEVLKAAAATGGMMVLGTAVAANNSSRTGGSNTDVDVDTPDISSSSTSNGVPDTSTDTATPTTTQVETDTTQTTTDNVPDTATPTTTQVEANTTQTTTDDVLDTTTPTTTQVEANTTEPTSDIATPDVPNTTLLISSLVNALPENLRGVVDITFDESLSGSTVRVYYQPEVQIRVGRDATALDIELHVPTVRTLRRYQGLTGKVRALIERISNWIERNGEPPVFSRAWEAKLELQKLPAIIEARQAKLASADLDGDTRAQLETEIADLESQITRHARTLDQMDVNPGVGYVAVEGISAQDKADFQQINKNLINEGKLEGFIQSTGVQFQDIVEIYSAVKKVTGHQGQLSINVTTELLREINKRGATSAAQVRQITASILKPDSEWISKRTRQTLSQQQRLNEAREIGLPSLEQEVIQQERSLLNKYQEVEALEKEVVIPFAQWSQYDLTAKDVNRKKDRIRELKKEIEALKDKVSQQQGQIDSLQTERSRERRIIHDEELRQQKKEADIRRQRAEELRQQNTFAGNVTAEQAWQRLIATSSDDTSSALWTSVLIEQGIISDESKIIAYLNTIKIQGQPVKKVRRQFKEHYRLKLWKLINSQSGSDARYQKMKQIADALDSQGKGYFSEGWHQSRYGKRRDPFSSKPINNSTQVVLKTEDAQKYGITLSTGQKF